MVSRDGCRFVTFPGPGDGADDLLVGAPFDDTEGRGGAVFLYPNLRGELRSDVYREIRGRSPESKFGLAVTRAGDLNKDGFEDFAVGAPYEGGGAVYVFLGAREGVAGAPRVGRQWLRAEELASQVVAAADFQAPGLRHVPLPATLATLGSSLAGGIDMDNNGYPGARLDTVVLAHANTPTSVGNCRVLARRSDDRAPVFACLFPLVFCSITIRVERG